MARTATELPRPFFASGDATEVRRRLLLISYHFPPGQAAGALRWQKLAQHAAVRGWALDVLTLDPSQLEKQDPSRLEELPPGTRVFGVPLREPWLGRAEHAAWRIYQRLRAPRASSASPATDTGPVDATRPESLGREEIRWRPSSPRDLLRAAYAWLDYARFGGWARDAAALALQLAERESYHAVIGCGPPHMAYEGARRLARRLGIPAVMDLRDPWSLWQRLPESIASPVWLALARRYEARAVAEAALVVLNTERVRAAMQALYPAAAQRMIAVMNGYDEEAVPRARHEGRFVVGYAGAIYIDRDPRPLFRAAATVIREHGLTPDAFGIELMGHVHSFQDLRVEDLARAEGIAEFVRVHPPRPRQEALAFQARAAVLVSLPQDSDLAIPSKVFEYMQFEAWVLALAEPGSATALALQGTPGIDIVSPADLPGLVRVLRERYLQFARGERPVPVARADGRFSRRAQAEILFDALEHHLGAREAPVPARSAARPQLFAP